MNIHNYICSRIPEPVSVHVSDTQIAVSWIVWRRVYRRTRTYTADKAERVCDELIADILRDMGY